MTININGKKILRQVPQYVSIYGPVAQSPGDAASYQKKIPFVKY